MKKYGKTLLSFAAVALISSSISVGAYAILSGDNKEMHENYFGFNNGEQNNNVCLVNTSNSSVYAPDFTAIAENSLNAVVSIRVSSTEKTNRQIQQFQDPFFEFFFGDRFKGQQQPQMKIGTGSGVIISNDGYIITNNHVVANGDKYEVTLNDKRMFNAKLIGTDPSTDIALLKIEGEDFPILSFGNSDLLKVGEWVLAVGNPMGLNSTVTAGIVSAKGRTIGTGKSMSIESYIQTDAAVNPGNSGGALVNTNGELIGINTLIVSETGSYIGYSFAVPSNIAIKIVNDLKEYGTVQRALLGVTIIEMNADFANERGIDFINGVYIESVSDRSSAKEAGLEKGDIITGIDGINITSSSKLQELISLHHPGDKIIVTISRNGKIKDIEVVLKNQNGDTSITKSSDYGVLGVGFSELTKDKKSSLAISSGVEVTGVKDGKFQRAGIRKGFIIFNINGEIVNSPDDIERIYNDILNSANRDKVMFITGMYPNGRSAYYAIDIAND